MIDQLIVGFNVDYDRLSLFRWFFTLITSSLYYVYKEYGE